VGVVNVSIFDLKNMISIFLKPKMKQNLVTTLTTPPKRNPNNGHTKNSITTIFK
jgi:hypothetical protein